mgnify:CR=1 FL=1
MLKRIQDDFKIQLILITLLCFVAYGNTIKHGFVLDDNSAILNNSSVKKGLSGISEIWSHSFMYGYLQQEDATYRPVTSTWLAVLYEFFGDNSTPYHFTQILLYLLLCILVLFYLKRLLRDFHPLYPLLITLVFLVHPLHTEVIANIKSVDEILALLFGVLSLHLFLLTNDKAENKLFPLAVLSFFFALTSKESAITLLVLFPFQLWFFRSSSLKATLTKSSVLFLPLGLYFFLRITLLDSMTYAEGSNEMSIYNNSLLAANSFTESIGSAFLILGYYLKLIFLPSNLSYDYSFNVFPIVGLTNISSLVSILLYLALGALSLLGIIRKWKFAFGLLMFLALLSISSNLFVKIGSSGSERFLFAPLLGFVIFVVLSIDQIHRKKKLTWLKESFVTVLSLVLIAVFTSMTISRNSDWKSEESLFLADVEKVPESFRANLLAASIYQEKADNSSSINAQNNLNKKALTHLKQVYKIYPEFEDTYIQMAQVYRNLAAWNKMKTVSEAGLKINPKSNVIIALLADAHLKLNEFADCRKYFLKLENSDDTLYDFSAKYNIGASYLNEQNFDSAIVWFQKVRTIKPNDITTNYYLAMSYFQVGKMDLAIQFFSKIPNTHDTYAHSQSSIGTIFLIQENFEQALVHLNNALLVVPGDENILNNMIVAYQSLGQLDKAEECVAMINAPSAVPSLQ